MSDMDLSLGIAAKASDWLGCSYPENIKNVTVTARNGATAAVNMDPKQPYNKFYGGPVLTLSYEGFRLAYTLGISAEGGDNDERIANYRYVYSDPTQPTAHLEGSEVSYLKYDRSMVQHSLSAACPLYSKKLEDGETVSYFAKASLSTGTSSIIQGTEAWGEEGHERTLSKDRYYSGDLGVDLVLKMKSWEVYAEAGIGQLFGNNIRGSQYFMGLGVNYKITSFAK